MSAPALVPDASQEVARDVYVDEVEPSVTEVWCVSDLTSADWALSRLADLEREQAENRALEAAAISRIKLKAELLNEKLGRGVAFFRSRIEAYAETHRAELLGGGKKKSRALLHGTIGWRKTGGGLEVKDEAALLAWAQSQPAESGVLRIKESPALDEIGKAFKRTGEIPPGMDVKPEVEKLIIDAALGGTAHAK